MQKHDCVVIGDSLAAIHAACELSKDSHVTLIRSDSIPVEIHETKSGSFDCDIASGCDLSYYAAGRNSGDLYGVLNRIKLLPYAFHYHDKTSSVAEPSDENEYLFKLSRKFPNHMNCISCFAEHVERIHDLLDEIETKTGFIPPFHVNKSAVIFSQLHPWVSAQVARYQSMRFARFLTQFNLPTELSQLYIVMCHDLTGLGPESIDTLTGIEIISRRLHGLSYLDGGWVSLKSAMLEYLRKIPECRIIGGKPVDLIRTSSGIAYEVCIDERDSHRFDSLIIDQTIGMLAFDGSFCSQARFFPLNYFSGSHVDFKIFIGWHSAPPIGYPVGVNYLYSDKRFPPQAPHLVRIDCMPVSVSDDSELQTKITIRGQFPAERFISSWGKKVDPGSIRDDILNLVLPSIPLPENKPDYIEIVLPSNNPNPFVEEKHITRVTIGDFAHNHKNVYMINASGINGGSMRLAFRSAERIAERINHQRKIRNFLHEVAIKPVSLIPGFRETIER